MSELITSVIDKRARELEANEGRLFIGLCPDGMGEARRRLLDEWDEICRDMGIKPEHRQAFLRASRRRWRLMYDRKAHGHSRVVDLLERVGQQRKEEDKARGLAV